jgi:hypothetical protein
MSRSRCRAAAATNFTTAVPGLIRASLPAKGLDARDVHISGLHIGHDQDEDTEFR